MKLQLAFDFVSIEDALNILSDLCSDINIVEIGTPFLMNEGLEPVRAVKRAFPGLSVLADLKIMDAGAHEARMAFDAGADIVTVLGAADDVTIGAALEVTKEMNRQILIDMINVKELAKRTEEVDRLGVDFVCIHTAFDLQDQSTSPLNRLRSVKNILRNAQIEYQEYPEIYHSRTQQNFREDREYAG